MLKLTLILLLTSIQGLWAQDDSFLFGKVGSRVTTTAWENTPPDILSNIAVCWQNGDTVDITGNGNNLTGTHTDPEITPNGWDSETYYDTGDLVSYTDVNYRSLIDRNKGSEPVNDKWNWVYHAPQRVSSGLANIPYAFRLNCYDNLYTAPSANEFHYQGENVTFTFWVSGTYSSTIFLMKGNEWLFRDFESNILLTLGDEPLTTENYINAPSDILTHYAFVVDYEYDGSYLWVLLGLRRRKKK